MKRLLYILLLLCPTILFGQGGYVNIGSAWQVSKDGINYRVDRGNGIKEYFWTLRQIDSLVLNLPPWPVADSSGKAVSMAVLHSFADSTKTPLDSLYFRFKSGGIVSLRSRLIFPDTVRIVRSPTNIYDLVNLNYYNAHLPVIPTNVSSFTNDASYATVTQVKVNRNGALFGQTASQPLVINYANTGGDNTYTVGAWLNYLSGSGTVIVQVTWIDGHSNSHTKTFYEDGDPSGTTYTGTNASFGFNPKCIRVKDATTITVSTTITGTPLYEVGGFIKKIVGDGGL